MSHSTNKTRKAAAGTGTIRKKLLPETGKNMNFGKHVLQLASTQGPADRFSVVLLEKHRRK